MAERRGLVIGYGNPLRGDDGFGRLAAELVSAHGLDIAVIVTHQLGPELAVALSEAEYVVFLDARRAGEAMADEAGTLRAATVAPRTLSPTALSHDFSPGALLALARAAYGRAPPATLVTATAADFAHGADISVAVRTAARRAAEVIARLAASGRLNPEHVCAAFASAAPTA